MIDEKSIRQHRERALTPDRPVLARHRAKSRRVFSGARGQQSFLSAPAPTIVQDVMDRFAARTGRSYHLFDYVGAPDAERVIVLMGSGAGAAEETVEALNKQGEKVGLAESSSLPAVSMRKHFLRPCRKPRAPIAVLDRTKEPGSPGEPLYLDVVTALREVWAARTVQRIARAVIGGRYGLSSKEFTPAMVKAVFDEIEAEAVPRIISPSAFTTT